MKNKNVKKDDFLLTESSFSIENLKNNRVERVDVRLTKEEKKLILEDFKTSHFVKFSQYLRSKLLEKPLTKERKTEYIALIEAGKLRTDTIRKGTNFNQLVKGMNTYKNCNFTAGEKKSIQETTDDIKRLMQFFNDFL